MILLSLKLKPLKLRKIEVKENPFSVGNDKYKKMWKDYFMNMKKRKKD